MFVFPRLLKQILVVELHKQNSIFVLTVLQVYRVDKLAPFTVASSIASAILEEA